MPLCDICSSLEGKYRCSSCGRVVCELDYLFDRGLCAACGDAACEICGRYPSINKCSYCGRACCEDCLVQLTPVLYVCAECYSRAGGRAGE